MVKGVQFKNYLLAFALSFFFIIASYQVSAISTYHACAAGSDNVIVSLYSPVNSHAALWNDPDNMFKICYNELFGINYTLSDPHNTDINNIVLKLSNPSNAHVEGPAGTNYQTNVIFGDLKCRMIGATESDYLPGEVEVVSLSDASNAHVAIAGYYSSSENYKIMCSSAFAGNPTQGGLPANVNDAYWQNGLGTRFGSDSSYVNNTVYLVAQTDAVVGSVNFTIFESDLLGDDYIKSIIAPIGLDGKAIAEWNITDADMVLGGSEDPSKFYFNASTSISSKLSGDLNVNNIQGPNNPPVVSILNPLNRGIYYTNVPITFLADVGDAESVPSIEWSVSDDSISVDETTKVTFDHAFITAGQKTIKLKAIDSKDSSLKRTAEVSILVLASPGVFSYINYPSENQIIFDNNIYHQPNIATININGSESYVVNSTSTTGGSCLTTVTCLRGNCPIETQQSPSCSIDSSVKLPVANSNIIDYSDMFFNWTFEQTGSDAEGSEGADVIGIPEYSQPYGRAGVKNIILNVSYVGLESLFHRRFEIRSQCSESGLIFYEFDQNGDLNSGSSTPNNGTACSGPDGEIDGLTGNNDDCCQSGFMCTANGCVQRPVEDPLPGGIFGCGRFTAEDSCNTANMEIVKEDYEAHSSTWQTLGGGCTPYGTNVCKCSWDAADSGICKIDYTEPVGCAGNDCNVQLTTCSVDVTSSAPDNGYCTVNYNKKCSNGNTAQCIALDCVDGTEQHTEVCGKPNIALPFFGMTQFFLAAILIFAVYVVMFRKSSKK